MIPGGPLFGSIDEDREFMYVDLSSIRKSDHGGNTCADVPKHMFGEQDFCFKHEIYFQVCGTLW